MKGIGESSESFARYDRVTEDAFAVSQSVKEVLQSLVDDGLVQADKIGSSNCTTAIVVQPDFRLITCAYMQSFGVFHHNAARW